MKNFKFEQEPSAFVKALQNKGESPLEIHKSGRGRLRELFFTEFNFTMLVVTRAGRLREWSQGEL